MHGLTLTVNRPDACMLAGPGAATRSLRGLTLLLMLACLSALQGGCAGMSSVTSQVSSFGSWPEARKPGRYVFERLPSQQNQSELQDQLEAAAQPALTAAGFERVSDVAKADVTVQVATQLQVDRAPRYDPFWSPYGPYGVGPYPYGPYGPGNRAAFGGWWGRGGRGGLSFSMAMEPPWVQMQVDVLIRDRATHQVLYETHARHDRIGSVYPALYPYLFEAALKDFPQQAISPRAVTVTIPPDNH
jgi:hypothetical protein